MKITAILTSGIMLALVTAGPAAAQSAKIQKGTLTGNLQSGAAMPAAGEVVNILTTKSGSYVITQACITSSDLHVEATGLGELLCDRFLGGVGMTGCMKFEPGIVLPAGAVVKCDNTTGVAAGACLLSIVETK